MVLDTDTYNEIDDQFALVYALLSPERVAVEALYAAPFHNSRSSGPADGMEKSYEEILRLLDRLNLSPQGFAFRGSRGYLPAPDQPQQSEAAHDLVEKAMSSRSEPFYVVAIGAITNVASAILIEPRIIEKIVIVWLAGHAFHWPDTREFNLRQDLHAARLIFDCGVPLVHVPCYGVTTHLHTTLPEIEQFVQGRGAIGDYLAQIFRDHSADHFAWSKVLWDMAAVAWLINHTWVPTNLVHSPIITEQVTYSHDQRRHLIRSAYFVHRDPIFRDFFSKLNTRGTN